MLGAFVMTPLRRIALSVFAGVLLMAAVGYLFSPRFPEHIVDYRMPGNPGPKIAAAQAAAIERRERVIDQTIWLKEMETRARFARYLEKIAVSMTFA